MLQSLLCLMSFFIFSQEASQNKTGSVSKTPTPIEFHKKETTHINGKEIQSEHYKFNLLFNDDSLTLNGVEIDPNSFLGFSIKGVSALTTLLISLAILFFVIFLLFFVGILIIPIFLFTVGLIGLCLLPSFIPALFLVAGLYLLLRLTRNKKNKQQKV